MSSQNVPNVAAQLPSVDGNAELNAPNGAGAKIYVEDGWIFSQQPGKGVECLRRYEDVGIVARPNEVRHQYPSN